MTMTAERPLDQFAAARRAMIDSQLRTSGVNETWVLAAMSGLAREDFVPAESKAAAYTDRAIPLSDGTFLAAPLVHARILMEAAPTAYDHALLVGDGAGYLAALLRPLVASLDSVSAQDAITTDGKASSYSLIVIDGAAEHIPDNLADQMTDQARIVTGLVDRGITRLAIGQKAAGELVFLALSEIGIPVLSAFTAPKRWAF